MDVLKWILKETEWEDMAWIDGLEQEPVTGSYIHCNKPFRVP
jgi:hypothetical protein